MQLHNNSDVVATGKYEDFSETCRDRKIDRLFHEDCNVKHEEGMLD